MAEIYSRNPPQPSTGNTKTWIGVAAVIAVLLLVLLALALWGAD